MGWSLKIGRIAGITVFMHMTFVLFIVWVGLSHWLRGHSATAALTGIAFILALFGCVLLHELGHSLTARKYGIQTRDITLLPIGGVARLERMPDDPRQELWVAIAGPAVNVVIAALLYAWLQIAGGWEPLARLDVGSGSFVQRLMVVNVVLVLFNLLPAFPMDGGRVLRALLALRMDYTRATQIAANVGQAMALLFGFAGLLGQPMLLFIAFFVWIGAAGEANMTQMKSALGGIPIERAMQTNFQTLAVREPLSRAVELVLAGSQHDFPVLEEDGRVAGVLTRADLLSALAQRGQHTPIAEVMRRDICVADAAEMLEPVFARLQQDECPSIPVTRNGQLAGLLTTENVGEFLMIQAALRAERNGSQPDRTALAR